MFAERLKIESQKSCVFLCFPLCFVFLRTLFLLFLLILFVDLFIYFFLFFELLPCFVSFVPFAFFIAFYLLVYCWFIVAIQNKYLQTKTTIKEITIISVCRFFSSPSPCSNEKRFSSYMCVFVRECVSFSNKKKIFFYNVFFC